VAGSASGGRLQRAVFPDIACALTRRSAPGLVIANRGEATALVLEVGTRGPAEPHAEMGCDNFMLIYHASYDMLINIFDAGNRQNVNRDLK
jgi:hypothetical protein